MYIHVKVFLLSIAKKEIISKTTGRFQYYLSGESN